MWAIFIPLPIEGGREWWGNYHPDEHNHVRVIEYIAAHHRLPPFEGVPPQSLYTSVHPPLYHVTAALLYGLGRPLLGHAGMLLLLRFLGCALGAGTVYLTYRAARYLLPAGAAVLAAGVVAGVPMFVSLSSGITNETLAAFTASGALCTMIAGIRYGFVEQRRRLLALSLWVAAAIATKLTCLPLLAAAFLALLAADRRRRRRRAGKAGEGVSTAAKGVLLRQMATVIGVCALVIGWWLVRNQIVYGDPLMAAAHQRMWSQTPGDAAAAVVAAQARAAHRAMTTPQFLANTARGGWQSFWGIFDGFSRPLPMNAYYAIGALQFASMIGLIMALRRGRLRMPVQHLAGGVLLLFAALLLIMFVWVNVRVYSPQGRYLFPLLLPLGLATAAGWRALFPSRLRTAANLVLLLGLLALNVYALIFMSVRPDTGS